MTHLTFEINGVVRKVGDPHDTSQAQKSWVKSENRTTPMKKLKYGIKGICQKWQIPSIFWLFVKW